MKVFFLKSIIGSQVNQIIEQRFSNGDIFIYNNKESFVVDVFNQNTGKEIDIIIMAVSKETHELEKVYHGKCKPRDNKVSFNIRKISSLTPEAFNKLKELVFDCSEKQEGYKIDIEKVGRYFFMRELPEKEFYSIVKP